MTMKNSELIYNKGLWLVENYLNYDGFYPELAKSMKENEIRILKNYKDKHIKNLDNGGIDLFIFAIPRPLRMVFYQEIYNLIPDEDKYRLFRSIYIDQEFVFGDIPKTFLDEIFKLAPKNLPEYVINKQEKDGYLIIHRGGSSKSTPVKKAFSWTLDYDIAKWFATRFTTYGYIHTGKVHLSKIIDYIDDRGEQEVIVRFEDIQGIIKEKVSVD